VLSGLLLSFVFKQIGSFAKEPIKESALILLNGYAVYLLGDFLGLSGIIALFTCAVIFSMYGFQNLSTEAKHGTILAFDTVRYIAQAFIFAYLGASLLTIQTQLLAFALALLLILLVPLIRLLTVLLLPLLYRIAKRQFPLGSGERKMLWYCGLMRGVIAFALSLQIQS
jgi:NhaP-type Na+/H+ or K+/H+ antiporter